MRREELGWRGKNKQSLPKILFGQLEMGKGKGGGLGAKDGVDQFGPKMELANCELLNSNSQGEEENVQPLPINIQKYLLWCTQAMSVSRRNELGGRLGGKI